MNKNLLIIFVKNILLGKVKTRLAKSIGDLGAFEVYKALVEITEKASENVNADVVVYFSDVVIENKWPNHKKYVQYGNDLGERMHNAFVKGFEDGYERVVLIGSDLPELTNTHIDTAFNKLNDTSIVLGPAEDGGYYLIGMHQLHACVFKNKDWSTEWLFKTTTEELIGKGITYDLLEVLNDIDTIEDLKHSSIVEQFKHLVPKALV